MKRLSLIFTVFLLTLPLFAVPTESDYGHPENSPLYFGNPSDAVPDETEDWNFLMEKEGYTLSYNNVFLGANWVGWHLCAADLGDADRTDKFKPDTSLPSDWYKVKKADYQFAAYGFDRGHLCPSADRTTTSENNAETFLMTNMLPQAPDLNRIVWMHLENYERELVQAGNELYIFAGGYGRGGIGNRGYFEEIRLDEENSVSTGISATTEQPVNISNSVTGPEAFDTSFEQVTYAGDSADEPETSHHLAIQVPQFCWKVILVLPEGTDDLVRAATEGQIIAVFIPNQQGCQEGGDWEMYECSIDYIEELTHLDFFELMENSD